MSSIVFRSSILIFLLLLFNGGSIALGALPYFYGPATAFQVAQLAAASAAFIFTLLLPCLVIAKKGSGVYAEAFAYLLIAAIDIVISVFITFRWVSHKFENDYGRVPKSSMVIIMVVSVSWAAALVGAIGFILAMIDSCSRAIHKDKGAHPPTTDRGSMLPFQRAPRDAPAAPYAQPHTTYMRPGY